MSADRPTIPFVIVGHINSGKSTLAGHLLQLSGQVDEHTFEKLRLKAVTNKQRGAEYAYLLDSLEEEQARNVTMLFNLVDFEYQEQNYTLVDCPGHQIYVRNLLSGLNATNPAETIGCLVVSLAPGEFEAGVKGGQTLEDLLLLRAVGIRQLVVLLNKVDLVDSERKTEVQTAMLAHVGRMGFPMVRFHAISGYSGQGLPEFLALLKEMALQRKALVTPPIPTPHAIVEVRLKLLFDQNLNLLFTPGLDVILHYGAQEHQVELVAGSLRDAKGKLVPFARNNDVITVALRTLNTTPLMVAKGGRVILRREQNTLAFGEVL
jgi:translation elongation factor EF-Tu-like GTPase